MAGSGLAAPTQEENERVARSFERSRNADGYVDAEEAERLLRRTGLQEQQLSSIWDLSDLDRDRRLSLREFICAMALAEQVRKGQALPVEVHPEQQEAIAAGVERILARAKPREELSLGLDSGRGPELLPARTESSLGQLAQVLKLVARSEPGELQGLTQEVVAERRQLEEQLQRRRGLEEELREARGRLDEAKELQRKSAVEAAAAQRRIAQMQDELVFVSREVSAAEEDLQLLRQVCGPEKERKAAPYTDPDEERRDVLSKVRAERELLMKDQKVIQELRDQLEEVFKQKHEAQSKQQVLLEKQRQCEQDRSLMLTAIEAERGKLMSSRDDRLRLWKERSDLEKQLQDVDQERLLVSRQTPGRNVPEPRPRSVEKPRRKGVPHETLPTVIHQPMVQEAPRSAPKHWYVPPRRDDPPPPVGLREGDVRRDHRGIRADP